MLLRSHFRFWFLILATVFSSLAQAKNENDARLLVHTLNYLGGDYGNAVKNGKITNEDEYAEMLEFSESSLKYAKETVKGWPTADSLLVFQLVNEIEQAVKNKAEAQLITEKTTALSSLIIKKAGLKTFPSIYPNLANGKKLFAQECSKCHGKNGYGDGPEGLDLNPAPRNFHDAERMKTISASHAFNAIRLGVEGTGMLAHPTLSEEEVWDLAFYVLSIRHEKKDFVEENITPALTLDEIANLTDEALLTTKNLNSDQISFLRVTQPQVSNDLFIGKAIGFLKGAQISYENFESEKAVKLATMAYLEGIEPIELSLKAADPNLATTIEKQFWAVRKMMDDKKEASAVTAAILEIEKNLEEADKILQKREYSFWLALMMSISILLREGLEAFLVIMVILSVIKAANIKNANRWIHGGWLAAIILGIALWFVSEKLIPNSAQNRELVEAIVSFIAVAMLLYVGFWLHSKTEVSKWKEYVNGLVKNAVQRGSLWGLAALSFFVVFREVFESVLFLSALNLESSGKQSSAILLGVLASGVIITIFTLVVLKYSAKLPIPRLFKFSSIVMGILAVILIGKGVHSLQETGAISITGISMFRIELLGIYPTIETCIAQLAIAGIVFYIWNFSAKPAKPSA